MTALQAAIGAGHVLLALAVSAHIVLTKTNYLLPEALPLVHPRSRRMCCFARACIDGVRAMTK